ncbi:unnamed protein product [Candida verbasci]|uniref:PHD-type domain-containing protein n=1 Tax=Candida verbasci TaxID=1227364 RepID=A0A9W4U018_9ASCO|nr:unnamed protein product [Candida verbasci]
MSTTDKQDKKIDYSIKNSDVVSKYKTAGDISNRVLQQVKHLVVDGSKIYDICVKGDELMNEELSKIYNSKKTKNVPKGIAFPTSINPNHIPAHLSPISQDDVANLVLKDGDVVSIQLGVQIDGFPAIVGETFVIGEEKTIDGKKADLLHAAWLASEAAIGTFKPGNRNWDITNIVSKVAKEFETSPLENMLSHNQERLKLYGPKEIILNPSKENKSSMETCKFEEGDVFGLDILISTSSDGKVKPSNFRTSLYKLTGETYALKMKMSHKILSEFKSKCNSQPFPYNIRNLEDPKKARGGLAESVNHKILLPYDIVIEKDGEFIAQFYTTFALTKHGIVKYTSPNFNKDLYKSDKEIKDEEIIKLLQEPINTKTNYEEKKNNQQQEQQSITRMLMNNGKRKAEKVANGQRKSARLAEIPKLKSSPNIIENKTNNNKLIETKNSRKIFIEPELASPCPSYTGLPLEEPPSAKIKKEALWTKSKKDSTPDIELDSETYHESFEKLNEEEVEESELRSEVHPVKQKQPTRKLKLTLKTPQQQPSTKRLKKIKIISPSKSPSTKLLDHKISTTTEVSNSQDGIENDDFCYACGLPGIFICCESCPKSFHFLCCDPPIDIPPEEDWFCKECYGKKYPFLLKDYSDFGVFGKLLNVLEVKDKKTFQLPKFLREDTFKGVMTDDNGDYIDDEIKPNKPIKNNQINGFNKDMNLEIDSLYDESGHPYLCHSCGESGQNQRGLIHCDYCNLVYHLYCLNPPMYGPKTIGNKWKCPNHISDLLPRGFPKLRQFKETENIETSLHSNFMKIASMGNIIIKVEEEEVDHLPIEREVVDYDVLRNWGNDKSAIHPNYKPQNYKIENNETGVYSESIIKKMNGNQVYKVPERSIILDFVNKVSKQDILNDLKLYDDYARIENNKEEYEFVNNINEIKEREKRRLNLDALLNVISKENLPPISSKLNDCEIDELKKVKQLIELKGYDKLMEFLKS